MVNLQLQGDRLNLIEKKSILSAFLASVKLKKQNIGRGNFSQFPNLSQTSCQEDDVSTYVQHLNALYSDFESRFEDILTMVIPPWIINPYSDIEETNVIIQEELTELSTNEELKVQFKNGYQQFWLQDNIPINICPVPESPAVPDRRPSGHLISACAPGRSSPGVAAPPSKPDDAAATDGGRQSHPPTRTSVPPTTMNSYKDVRFADC
ncbi:unnamed protein product [Acanthoscelides obtectus]|uniref:Uncharacterized protein n=1 Tax=Acanthoscelides obtectus TaxID=200917 RepID=A0A9P0KDN0_ACAOB|nr:unnamed protein product [Acanthoscelides obtectus]CAK1635026.1 General transcription factor II-I repeat domain-containing protein 2 [Acanthoscelides obtectus]